VEATELGCDEKQILKLLKKEPLAAESIMSSLDRERGTVYKMIFALEKKQHIKIGYKKPDRIRAEALFLFVD
jgi:predicted transcriptional regulator